MKILDNIATKIADKVNAKNDEVMLLTQENELLQQKLAASELTVSDYQKKIKKSDNELVRLNSKYTEVKKQLKDLAESGERQVDTIQDYAEQINELQNSKPDKKLKQRNKELENLLVKSENLIKANTIYRKTYEFISDEQNRQTIIDNFSHNLSKWISDKNLTDTEVAKKLGTSRNIVGNLKTGKRAVNVNTIQKFDIELCEYFECSVYELVTVKMEEQSNEL
ncbi:helix-turn-helix domain-containing protein [Vagococcus fluvialis]|uniref:helix-turn-helix domain-containing protein n=1 Tax=Vagococcus fluvialis TaxID=2738 RepID=UPI00289009BF|nr:helix-turn-helix domain-containing protein [Vagococcus fluvialis]MDT2782905.1 helix-turn-helix domain-containing protein [Vagococcus fluvialis]